MSKSPGKPKPTRQYPAFWEKAVPVFLILLGIGILVILFIILGVALGLFNWV